MCWLFIIIEYLNATICSMKWFHYERGRRKCYHNVLFMCFGLIVHGLKIVVERALFSVVGIHC